MEAVEGRLVAAIACLSAFSWQPYVSIKPFSSTLWLTQKCYANALFLENHAGVKRVVYPGPSHPQYELQAPATRL
jgi:hypothetical protein